MTITTCSGLATVHTSCSAIFIDEYNNSINVCTLFFSEIFTNRNPYMRVIYFHMK